MKFDAAVDELHPDGEFMDATGDCANETCILTGPTWQGVRQAGIISLPFQMSFARKDDVPKFINIVFEYGEVYEKKHVVQCSGNGLVPPNNVSATTVPSIIPSAVPVTKSSTNSKTIAPTSPAQTVPIADKNTSEVPIVPITDALTKEASTVPSPDNVTTVAAETGQCESLFTQSSPSSWTDTRQGHLEFPIPETTISWSVEITFDKVSS